MKREKLSMLPSQRFDDAAEMPVMERDGFVDDAVIQSILAGPVSPRHVVEPADLVLAADDMDFAGWILPKRKVSPFMQAPLIEQRLDLPLRRAAEPELDEPGLGEPHRGNHRWWIAGLAGGLTTMLFSVLLLTLSSREHLEMEGLSIIRVPEKTQQQPVKGTPPTPELTGLESEK
jgi:hypothetical protein